MDNYKMALRKNILIIVIALLICILVPSVITLSVTGIIEADISDELIDGRRIDVKYRHAVKSVDINKFIVMVLADRLDMSSQIEVLKAESIMVRTDIYRIMGNDMNIDSSQLGMSFLTENQMKNNWGSKYNDNYNLISDCVAATGGIIMMCQRLPAHRPVCCHPPRNGSYRCLSAPVPAISRHRSDHDRFLYADPGSDPHPGADLSARCRRAGHRKSPRN